MAGHHQRHTSSKQHGFTIVELLIVIIVIAILAAIVIVAYNGVTRKAQASAAQSAARDLAQLLAISYTTNSTYPSDLSTVNNGGPMPSNGTTYVYHPGSGNSSYCATVTNGSSSYMITDTATVPAAGACPGDGVNGVPPITNLAINPSAATAVTYWSTNLSSASTSRDSTTTRPGSLTTGSIKTTFTAAATVSTQLWDGTTTPLVPVSPGDTITISAWVESSIAGRTLTIDDRWRDINNAQVSISSSSNISVPTTWTRITYTAQAPAGAAYDHISFFFGGQTGDSWWLDDVMVTKGGTDYTFADGSTSGWLWNGTPGLSTSTGPPQ